MSDDFTSDINTQGRLMIGVYSTGTIENSIDTDWFKITLTAGQMLRFDLEGKPTDKGTLINTYLTGIYDSNGTLLANTINDNSGIANNSLLVFTPSVSGDYYISAGSSFDPASTIGTYSLIATSFKPAKDDFVADISTKGQLIFDQQSKGRIEMPGDIDWFKIAVTAGQLINIDLEGRPTHQGSLEDTYLSGVYDSAGVLIYGTNNDDNGDTANSHIAFTPTTDGNYYIAAGGYSADMGTYHLKATKVVDDFTAMTNTTGRLTFDMNSSGSIEYTNDTDWFKISLAADQMVRFNLESSQGYVYFYGIYDSNGAYIYNSYATEFFFSPKLAGDYYIAAYGYATGTYTLKATPVTEDFTANINTTGLLTVGSDSIGNLENYNDIDWFKIALSAGQTMQFDLTSTNNNAYLNGIYDSNGILIEDTFNVSSKLFSAKSTGDYFVAVNGYSVSTYDLKATLISDDFSADITTQGQLIFDIASKGAIEFSGDIDWFKIALTADQIMQFDLTATNNSASLNGIYDSAGHLIDNSSNNSQLFFTPKLTSDYYIATYGYVADTYYLIAKPYIPPVDDFTADINTVGRLNFKHSSIGTLIPNDSDWFKIALTQGQLVQFRIDAGFDIALYNSNGDLLGNYKYSSFVVPLSGDYFVAVSDSYASANMTGSSYTLNAINLINGNYWGDKLLGFAGSDIILGEYGDDTLSGAAGNDTLYGGYGNDQLFGGLGDDVLIAAQGNNLLTGGKGKDIFQLTTAYNVAKITDFHSADDTLQLASDIFTALPYGLLANDNLISGENITAAKETNDYLIYNQTTGVLYYDDDANGIAVAPVQIAILGTTIHPVLTADNFAVIY